MMRELPPVTVSPAQTAAWVEVMPLACAALETVKATLPLASVLRFNVPAETITPARAAYDCAPLMVSALEPVLVMLALVGGKKPKMPAIVRPVSVWIVPALTALTWAAHVCGLVAVCHFQPALLSNRIRSVGSAAVELVLKIAAEYWS